MALSILKSKKLSVVLDVFGVFCMTSLIFNTLFYSFIVAVIPQCYLTDALIPYIECGNTWWGETLKLYFLYFSPFVYGVGLLTFWGVFTALSHAAFLRFFISLLYSAFIVLIAFSTVRILFKVLKNLVFKRKDTPKKSQLAALLLAFVILLPSGIGFVAKYNLIPPESSDRLINVNLWHDEFIIPRIYLKSWSLADIKKPEQEPSNFFRIPLRGNNAYPYVHLAVPIKKLLSVQDSDLLEIIISPYFKNISDDMLFQEREAFLNKELQSTNYHNKKRYPTYEKEPEREGDFFVYRSNNTTGKNHYESDIYLLRNQNGHITDLVQCMPTSWCIKKNHRSSRISEYFGECESKEECETCKRTCKDKSFGTNKYLIKYSFDKKYLDHYPEFRSNIEQLFTSFKTATD